MALLLILATLIGLHLIASAQREAARRNATQPAFVPVRRLPQPRRYRGHPLD